MEEFDATKKQPVVSKIDVNVLQISATTNILHQHHHQQPQQFQQHGNPQHTPRPMLALQRSPSNALTQAPQIQTQLVLPPNVNCTEIPGKEIIWQIEHQKLLDNTINPNRPTLTDKDNYATSPTIDILQRMSDDDVKRVRDLTIFHRVHGKIFFPGITNLFKVDICNVVQFGHGSFSLYNKQEWPCLNQGFNKHAIVTLYNCNLPKGEVAKFLQTFYTCLGFSKAKYEIEKRHLILEFYFLQAKNPQ